MVKKCTHTSIYINNNTWTDDNMYIEAKSRYYEIVKKNAQCTIVYSAAAPE